MSRPSSWSWAGSMKPRGLPSPSWSACRQGTTTSCVMKPCRQLVEQWADSAGIDLKRGGPPTTSRAPCGGGGTPALGGVPCLPSARRNRGSSDEAAGQTYGACRRMDIRCPPHGPGLFFGASCLANADWAYACS